MSYKGTFTIFTIAIIYNRDPITKYITRFLLASMQISMPGQNTISYISYRYIHIEAVVYILVYFKLVV